VTRGKGKRRSVSRTEVREFIGKAEEWLETAIEALAHDRFTAATGNAIHAGINAGDAICGARLGERSSAETHNEAVTMLRTVPIVGQEASNHLKRLLSKKSDAEYDAIPMSSTVAHDAVERAEKLVAIARRVAAESLPPSTP
jgi:hypothetical protein